MNRKSYFCFTLGVCLQLGLAVGSNSHASERMTLDHATVVVAADEPSYVQYGVEELVNYLKESTGSEIPVVTLPAANGQTQIIVGTKATQQVIPQNIPDEKFGDEGYLLRSVTQDGKQYLIVTGATPRGTKAALAALMKTIQVEGKSAFVPTPLDRLQKPSLGKRGIHFNGWTFNSPYSFRTWREEEWCRYLDILAYQGVNLFYVWPFMEIMPVPLSAEDQAYLEECRRVVDYAQKKHGMEVWIMQCANRVAKDHCGVADPRLRPYWRPSQQDLNPANPEHFAAIMASREALYRSINNADGVCNIDSDPGSFPGSPLADYIKVLQGCRGLLDRYNLHGKETKLINWMWSGWGDPQGLPTIQSLKQNLPEPWGLVVGKYSYLPFCDQEKTLEKTVFLPYNTIEGEPSYPMTNVYIDRLRKLFDTQIDTYNVAGAMGNLQTPLLQFPNMYFFTSVMSDSQYRQRPEKEVLQDLSGYLYPEHKQLLADCYLALKETDPSKIQSLANQLDHIVREDKLGSPGIFGRKLFPDRGIVAKTLLLQLNFCAARERLVLEMTPTTSKASCQKLLHDYFDAYLAWDTAHGWHTLWGWQQWPLGMFASDSRFSTVAKQLSQSLGNKSEVDSCFDEVAKLLLCKYDTTAVEVGCIAPLKKQVLAPLSHPEP